METFTRIWNWKYSFLFLAGLFVTKVLSNTGVDFEPCKKNDHLTDIGFTCCAGMRYDSPEMYRSKEYATACFTRPEKGSIVQTSVIWAAFKCLIDKAMGSFDPTKMPSILAKNLPTSIQTAIEEIFKAQMAKDGPYTGNSQLQGFENYANAWNAYYSAESKACVNAGTKKHIDVNNDNHCYSWIEQTTRRGDCCRMVPVPFELYPDPLVLQYFALKNYTAVHLLGMVGEYNWYNASVVQFSDNVANCRRMALSILQNKTTLKKLKEDIFAQIPPNYTEITESIIPPFMSQEVSEKIKAFMYNDTEILREYGTRNMMDKKTSIHQFIYADDWIGSTYDRNATRYLFWHCHSNFLLSSRYKAVDISPYCLMK